MFDPAGGVGLSTLSLKYRAHTLVIEMVVCIAESVVRWFIDERCGGALMNFPLLILLSFGAAKV